MTVEIKQLVIRAVVTSSEAPSQALPPAQAGQGSAATSLSRAERASLVAACVREVLRELQKSRDR